MPASKALQPLPLHQPYARRLQMQMQPPPHPPCDFVTLFSRLPHPMQMVPFLFAESLLPFVALVFLPKPIACEVGPP